MEIARIVLVLGAILKTSYDIKLTDGKEVRRDEEIFNTKLVGFELGWMFDVEPGKRGWR